MEREHQGRVKVRKRREGAVELVDCKLTAMVTNRCSDPSFESPLCGWPSTAVILEILIQTGKNSNPATTHWGCTGDGKANAKGDEGQSCEFCREVIWNYRASRLLVLLPTHKTKDLRSTKHLCHWL